MSPDRMLRGEDFGWRYEKSLPARKALGQFYSPTELVKFVVEHTVGAALGGKSVEQALALRVLDPSCGAGMFLLEVGRRILRHVEECGGNVDARMRRRVAEKCLAGIDVDDGALAVCRRALAHEFGGARFDLRHGDALLDDLVKSGEFHVVTGNPPWGQKGFRIGARAALTLRARFRTARGPLDPFKLFIERAIEWTPVGGHWGYILPDVLLLKDHQPARDLILESTEMTELAHAGRAFHAVNLDVILLTGRRVSHPRRGHQVRVTTAFGRARPRRLLQSLFLEQPAHRFNLFLTPEKIQTLRALAASPRLGDFFDMHEGVHSGNVRHKLFVDGPGPERAPLIVGGKEIARFHLSWAGKYIDLSPKLLDRTAGDYANLGRRHWHECKKIVVRRTGDRIVAAFDDYGYFVSNNLFVLVPRAPLSDEFQRATVALLNSELMTWYFRAVQPRTGRLFAELKLCHLSDFPFPSRDHMTPAVIHRLASRAAIDREVVELFELPAAARRLLCAKMQS